MYLPIMAIIFPGTAYEVALENAKLITLYDRKNDFMPSLAGKVLLAMIFGLTLLANKECFLIKEN